MKAKKKKENIRKENYLHLILVLVVVIFINIVGSFYSTRFDLTAEKRYSLSDETKKILKNLDDIVYFKVYLEGDFPSGFKRLRNSFRELLDELRAYNSNIEYEFINPSESADPKERNNTYKLLMEKGLNPTTLRVDNEKGVSQQIIFPGCILTYKSEKAPIELLQNSNPGLSPEVALNNSIQNLEFLIASNLKKIAKPFKKKVGFLQGHGELSINDARSFLLRIQEDYSVTDVNLNENITSLSTRLGNDSSGYKVKNKFDALIVAQPEKPFSEKDKFILDQYIMHGGKILWLVNPVFAKMDSIQHAESTVGINNDDNLGDMFFKYGMRLNNELVQDVNCLPIPLTTGYVGDQPSVEFFPWPYFPLVKPASDHPIVKNLNLVKTEFPGSIDILPKAGAKITPLLTTSSKTKTVISPALISLSITRDKLDETKYKSGKKIIAALLEGHVESVFKNRLPAIIEEENIIDYKDKCDTAAMILVADGNIIINQYGNGGKMPYPVGYDRFTRRTFGNGDFALNALNYLTDGPGLISLRSREVTIRSLDRAKVVKDKLYYQVINTVLPLIILLIFGLAHFIYRKRKYTKIG
ncbi:MAG: gliding motility-associated ABC transporter substrate-binding protein GldG [Hyphomicrobiales bacterium]